MSAQSRATPRRILIVSGDVVLRERLYDLLSRQALSVRTAANGRVGAEALVHEQPDLIIANSSANDCPGWGFPDWVRRFNERVPIILIRHPHEEPPDSRTARDIQAYFASDVSDEQLLGAISRWLAQGELRGEVEPINYPGTILAIDDEPDYLAALREFLAPRGCTLATAGSAEEGLSRLEREPIGLVLLDMKMSGMDGLVALKKMKQRFAAMPVIMMTAVEDQHLMAQAFALGAYEYIVKPYDFAALRTLLVSIKSKPRR